MINPDELPLLVFILGIIVISMSVTFIATRPSFQTGS